MVETPVSIADVPESLLPAVCELNAAEVPRLGPADPALMHWFARHAAAFRVAMLGDRLAGFLIGLLPGLDYPSPNYRWFAERYADFAYVDRVAVSAACRRAGIATRLYEDFASRLPPTVPFLTCEVNLEPPNPSSLRFHERLGFEQVGVQQTGNGEKTVALLARPLGPGGLSARPPA